MKEGHQFSTDISIRAIDANGNPLSAWVENHTKNITVSSRMNLGIYISNGGNFNDLVTIGDVFPSLLSTPINREKPVKLNVQVYSKSFREDQSLKGTYVEEGVKTNIKIEKVKQEVKFDGGSWQPSGSNLRFEILGGSIPRPTNGYNADNRQLGGSIVGDLKDLYRYNSFDDKLNYFTENGLSVAKRMSFDAPDTSQGAAAQDVFIGYTVRGEKHYDYIQSSGKMTLTKRDDDLTFEGNIEGYELGNIPTTSTRYYSPKPSKEYFKTIGRMPLTQHFIITNAENEYENGGKLNPNYKNNTVQTTWKATLVSYEVGGKTIPSGVSADTVMPINNRDTGPGAVHSLQWTDPWTGKDYNYPSEGNAFAQNTGTNFTYGGNLTAISMFTWHEGVRRMLIRNHKGIVRWNPEIATIIDDATPPDVKEYGNSLKVATAAQIDAAEKNNNTPIANLPESVSRVREWIAADGVVPMFRNLPSNWQTTYGINQILDYDWGVKKNTDYSLRTLEKASETDYDWYETYEEAKTHGTVSAMRMETKIPQLKNFGVVTPLMRFTDNANGTNIINGNYTTAAGDEFQEGDDGSWEDESSGIEEATPAEWSQNGELIRVGVPNGTSTKLDTIALKKAVYQITNSESNRDNNIPQNGTNAIEWRIYKTGGNSSLYKETELRTTIDFPKGVDYVKGSAYILNYKTGEKTPVETISEDDITKDRKLTFKLPTVTADSGDQFILHYDIRADESIVDIDWDTGKYKSSNQYASVYWSEYNSHPSDVASAILSRQMDWYTVNITANQVTAIIDSINKEYDEIGSNHIVTVRPYTTLSTPESNVKVLTKIPTTGFSGNLSLTGVSNKNPNMHYKVYTSSTTKNLTSVNSLDMSDFKEYTEGETVKNPTYVLVEVEEPMSRTNADEYYLHMQTDGNKGGDVYRYGSQGNTSRNYPADYQSNIVQTRILARDISGIFWRDYNNNGLIDRFEKRIANKEIELVQNGNVIATTTTDDNGYYSFKNLGLGNFTVRVKNYPSDYTGWSVTKQELNSDNGNKANENAQVTDITLEQNPSVDVDNSDHHNIGINSVSGFGPSIGHLPATGAFGAILFALATVVVGGVAFKILKMKKKTHLK